MYNSEPDFSELLTSDFDTSVAVKVPRESPRYGAIAGLSFPVNLLKIWRSSSDNEERYECNFKSEMMLLKVEDLDPDQQKERLELVVEGTRLGMWDWNPVTGEVIFDERWAGMLGYDLAEIEQSITSWERLVHPDDLADAYADIQAQKQEW